MMPSLLRYVHKAEQNCVCVGCGWEHVVHDEYNRDANAHSRITVGRFENKVAIKYVT